MSTTTGDSSHRYCTENGNPKQVTELKEAICSPDANSSPEEKQSFINILDREIGDNEQDTTKKEDTDNA